MLSVDTIRIKCGADLSRSYEFEDRGLKKSYRFPHWFRNILLNDACFLKIDVSKVGKAENVTVEFSTQKAQNKNHVSPLNFSTVSDVLGDVSAEVKRATGIEIDTPAGALTMCDFNYNWRLESELEVYSWLDVLRGAKYPNLKRNPFEDTTVYFRSSAYSKNIYEGKSQSKPVHQILFYAKSQEILELIKRKQISKKDLLEVANTLRMEEGMRGVKKIRSEAKKHGFADAKVLTVLSAEFAEEVIMESYKKLNLESDVFGKDEREAKLLGLFLKNGKIDDRQTREHFKRLYTTMKLADGIGGDNLLPLGIMTDSPFYRDKSELYDLGLWSSTPLNEKGKQQVLAGLSKPTMRRCSE